MSSDTHHDRVRRLFDDLVDLPASDRTRLLFDAGSTDADVAAEAERLLLELETQSLSKKPVFVFEDDGERQPVGRRQLLIDGERVSTPIGEVEILRLLSDPGYSNVSEVYLARHADAGAVAVKVLRESMMDYEIRHRFLVEAEALRRLDHPNIAKLLHVGPIEPSDRPGSMGLITRYIPGVPLDEWALEHTAEEIVRVMILIARAVHHVHLRQILHRDLKPANIIVTDDGQPVLLDLGVAKFLSRERNEFASMGQTVAGTLHYMAPEQLAPSMSLVDYRADIYALGVVLYELLTRRRLLFLAGKSEAEALRLKQELRVTAPRGLSLQSLATQVALIATSPRPEDRYESADKMADDLARAIAGRPLVARPLGPVKRLVLFVSRNPVPVAAAAIVFTALLVSVGLYLASQQQVAGARARAEARFDDTRSFARWAIYSFTDTLGGIPDTTGARYGLIREASNMLSRLAEDPVAGPDLLLELAEGYTRLGELLDEELGDNPQALRSFAAARALIDRHPQQDEPVVRMLRAWLEFRWMAAIDQVESLPFEISTLESSLAALTALEPQLANDPRLFRWRSRILCHYSRRQLESDLATDEIVESLSLAVRDGDRAAMLAPADAFAQAQPAIARFWLAHALYDRGDDRALKASYDAVEAARRLVLVSHPMAEIYLSRALAVRCWALARAGAMERFTLESALAVQSADRGVAREPNNKTAVRNADVIRIQLARVAFEAAQAGHDAPLGDALVWAVDANELFQARQDRGWTYEFEDVNYPPAYEALIASLRRALE